MSRGLFVLVLGWNLGQIYIKAQLSVKREMSNAKASINDASDGTVCSCRECRLLYSVSSPQQSLAYVRDPTSSIPTSHMIA
jgi:hypothetical protein